MVETRILKNTDEWASISQNPYYLHFIYTAYLVIWTNTCHMSLQLCSHTTRFTLKRIFKTSLVTIFDVLPTVVLLGCVVVWDLTYFNVLRELWKPVCVLIGKGMWKVREHLLLISECVWSTRSLGLLRVLHISTSIVYDMESGKPLVNDTCLCLA